MTSSVASCLRTHQPISDNVNKHRQPTKTTLRQAHACATATAVTAVFRSCRLPAAAHCAQTQSEHVRSRSATLMQQCCTHEKQKKI